MGDKFLKSGQFEKAVCEYTKLLSEGNLNYVLLNNRSSSYANLGNYDAAIVDAKMSLHLNSIDNIKGYYCLSNGHFIKGNIAEAFASAEAGLVFDEHNLALVQLRDKCRRKIDNIPELDPRRFLTAAAQFHEHCHEHDASGGHSHSHEHDVSGGHSHSHEHDVSGGHSHSHEHDVSGGHSHSHEHDASGGHSHSHEHDASGGHSHSHEHDTKEA